MNTSLEAHELSDSAQRRLRQVYPHLHSRPHFAALARELGLREPALHTLARSQGLSPRPSRRRATDDERQAELRIAEHRREASEVDLDGLQRRRRARIGDFSEAELAEAMQATACGHTPEEIAATLARPTHEVRLRLMSLGIERSIEDDERFTLSELACHLNVEVHVLVDEVLHSRLSASAPVGSGAHHLPDPGWTVGIRQIGAWLIAWPDHQALVHAEPALLIRAAMQVGAQVGRRMAALQALSASDRV